MSTSAINSHMRRPPSRLPTLALGSLLLSGAMLGTAASAANGTFKPNEVRPHNERITVIGNCSPKEPGLGNIAITYTDFPLGQTSVTNDISGPMNETVTSEIFVSPSNPSPVVTLSRMTPGTY